MNNNKDELAQERMMMAVRLDPTRLTNTDQAKLSLVANTTCQHIYRV